jgi:hypothetical protein
MLHRAVSKFFQSVPGPAFSEASSENGVGVASASEKSEADGEPVTSLPICSLPLPLTSLGITLLRVSHDLRERMRKRGGHWVEKQILRPEDRAKGGDRGLMEVVRVLIQKSLWPGARDFGWSCPKALRVFVFERGKRERKRYSK